MADEPLRLLVTGSRHASNYTEVVGFLNGVLIDVPSWRSMVVVVGDCPTGVDKFAREWAEVTDGVIAEIHRADWWAHRNAAGPIRNANMVTAGADLCLALPTRDSRGTWDCAMKAAKAGIPVRLWTVQG